VTSSPSKAPAAAEARAASTRASKQAWSFIIDTATVP
jgi:hypothetical protein